MPRESIPLDIDHLIAEYKSGRGIKPIAKSLGVHFRRVKRELIKAGAILRSISPVDNAYIVREYAAGKSPAAIGLALGIPPLRVTRILKRAGVPLRNGSEARIAMLARLSEDERNRVTRKGTGAITTIDRQALIARYLTGTTQSELRRIYHMHFEPIHQVLLDAGVLRTPLEARRLVIQRWTPERRATFQEASSRALRNYVHGEEWAIATARGRERTLNRIGFGEWQLATWLRQYGLTFVLQQAVGHYNVDIGILPIAVELFMTAANPLGRIKMRQKVEYLLNRGIHVLFIMSSPRHFLRAEVAEHVVAFLEEAQCDPSPVGQYRMIRGCGELMATSSRDLDNVTIIPAPRCAFQLSYNTYVGLTR